MPGELERDMRADTIEAQAVTERGNLDKPRRAGTALIRKVAVLGAGTMGSRIAAHIANAGVSVVLLDVVPAGVGADAGAAARNKLAAGAVEALKKAKPAAFYTNECARLIRVGNFEDDLGLI